jgi:hypothetical protein
VRTPFGLAVSGHEPNAALPTYVSPKTIDNRGFSMLRLASIAAVLAAVAAGVVAGSSPAAGEKHAKPFPQVIQLPTGFRPEGIEVGADNLLRRLGRERRDLPR